MRLTRISPARSAQRALVYRRAPLVLGVFAAAALLGTAWWLRRSVNAVSATVTEGVGERFASTSEALWRYLRMAPTPSDLDFLLRDFEDAGLRYVAYVNPDLSVMAAAGLPLPNPDLRFGVRAVGSRIRIVRALPVTRRWDSGSRRTLRRGGPYLLIIEYQPSAAERLRKQASTMAWAASCAALLLLLLAFLYSRSFSLRQALELKVEKEAHLARLGEAASVLAHELRNPLASLKGHAQLLVEHLEEGSRRRTKAELVVAEAGRIERLTDDLLAFVRSGTLRREPTEPCEVLRLALRAFDAAAFRVESADNLGLWSLDAERLAGAFENLLRNALEVEDAQGVPDVFVRLTDKSLCFAVRDFGAGLGELEAEGRIDTLFEPFHTSKIRRTGLGLAMARRVVEAHGGTVHARSALGRGAHFEIVLPPSARVRS